MQSLFYILFWPFIFVGELVRRFPKDLHEFRTTRDFADRAVIVSYWLLGLGLLVAIGIWMKHIAGRLMEVYRQYLA